MKLTKARLNKVFLKGDNHNLKQTRKQFKNKKVLTHTNTCRNRHGKNYKNMTLKTMTL